MPCTFAAGTRCPMEPPFNVKKSSSPLTTMLNGGSIGNLVPAANVQGILFAFRTPAQVFGALDSDLGDYLREEMKTKGLYAVPRGCFDNGFHQITCATRPIRSVDDLQGLKIRTPDAPIYVEAWKALGASPVV